MVPVEFGGPKTNSAETSASMQNNGRLILRRDFGIVLLILHTSFESWRRVLSGG